MRIWQCLVMVALMSAAGAAHAAPISDAAWEVFKTRSDASERNAGSTNFEDQLYAAAQANPSSADAIADFARRIKVDPDTADTYAGLIVDVVGYYKSCGRVCPLPADGSLYVEIERVAMAEPTGNLLYFVGNYVYGAKVPDLDSSALFLRLAWRHPAADDIFRDFNTYSYNRYYQNALLARHIDDPMSVPIDAMYSFSATDDTSGVTLALLEAAEAHLPDTPAAAAWHTKADIDILVQLIELGLDAEAARRYLALSPARRDTLFQPDCTSPLSYSSNFSDDVAASLWRAGQHDAANELLRTYYTCDNQHPQPRPEIDMVGDAIKPQVADSDLFLLYVKGPPDPDADGTDTYDWLSDVGFQTPAARYLVADRLGKAGYGDLAAEVRATPPVGAGWGRSAGLWQVMDLLPQDVQTRQKHWSDLIMAAQAAYAPAPVPESVHVAATAMKSPWTEKPLPDGVAAWQGTDDDGPDRSSLDASTRQAIGDGYALRYETSGDDAAIVFDVGSYDGMSSGLWLVLQRAGTWQRPIDLGLKRYYPYKVTADSQLPLMTDGRVQMEVQVREEDPDAMPSYDEPTYLRTADGLYIDAALSDLTADSDGDGVTDIEEARLGLKIDNDDSDGDGLKDGVDPLPLSPYMGGDWRKAEAARQILASFERIGAAPTLPDKGTFIIVSNSDAFAALDALPFQMIVYSDEDLKRLGLDGARFDPWKIKTFHSLDSNMTYATWSYSGGAGALLVSCDATSCTSQKLRDVSYGE